MNAVSPTQLEAGPVTWDERDRLAALERYQILDTPTEPDFDDIVRLAAETFGAPIAVVNLIADGRQWFKAEVGIGARELPLDVSICSHAILQSGTMVVPDTRMDKRFDCNPLVTAENGLRFYAGAVLKTDQGLPLGTVCVLDREPRPAGITDHQRLTLEVLARLVMNQLEMRRVIELQHAHASQLEAEIRDRKAAESARRLADERYRSLFDSLDSGFCIIEIAFDGLDKAKDYRFLEVNAAFAHQTGLVDAQGKWMRELVPEHEQHWFDLYGRVAKTGKAMRFENPAKGLDDRWFDVHAFAVGEAGENLVAVLFSDITDRRRGEIRRNALLKIGDCLRSLDTVPEITAAASEIIGKTLDAVRVSFGRVDATGEYVTIEKDWVSDGYASLAGRHRLADDVDVSGAVAGRQPVVVSDALASSLSGLRSHDAFTQPGTRARAIIPIQDHDGAVALLLVHSREPRNWAVEDLTFLRNAGDRVAASLARLDAEALQHVLNLELSHRMKNTLAMVQAIAKQTLRSVPDQAPVEAFGARLQALSTAHMTLLQQGWTQAKINDVVGSVLGTLEATEQFTVHGPSLDIGARAALSLSLLLHELMTNALKYGALSQPEGCISISWDVVDEKLTLEWRESKGPAVLAPKRKGFGSRLINMGLIGTGGVELRYLPTGLEADFSAPLSQVQQS
ncbi:MAG: GAF domain-containing protein [Hyphomicrobiaceae bacterium]